MAKKPPTIDETCEAAIASSAVEAREWAEAHPEDGFAPNYRENYADRFYEAGADRCWFDEFEEIEGAGVTTFETMIIRCPDDPAARRVVDLYLELQEREDSVDNAEAYVGRRYCLFSFYI
jgi:hypothetical protein